MEYNDNEESLAIEKLKKYKQEHIIKIMEKLDQKSKKELIEQVLNLDFTTIMDLYDETEIKKQSKKTYDSFCKFEPINSREKSEFSEKEEIELKNIGKKIINEGKYAVITMAGGQGTRLGFNGPKGTYKLDIGENGKYIFEILADTLKRGAVETGYKSKWYIMTSPENDYQTQKFFEEKNYFEYGKENIKFFKQPTLPLIQKDGKLLVGKDFKIREASDGNGGVYRALKQEKMLEDMKKNEIEWIYVCGVDNIMVNMVDTLFLGMTIKQKVEVASKSIKKKNPDEKVGVFCKRNGNPGIVEYIELPEKMRFENKKDGNLVYGDANIVSHLININAFEKMATQKLDYHVAVKKNSYLDENLNLVEPEENNSYKFETFIFDGFKYADDMAVLRVKREEEFSPIKNKEGADSPETAKEIYCKYSNIK